jgi:ubiquinone/menaquinone biosynthesis C-methylase UbiE
MTDLGIADDLSVFDGAVDIAGRTVVDAGCGPGVLSRHLLSRGACVIALEPDPLQAAKHAEGLACEPGLTFVETGAEAMPCRDASVDGVVFSKSLHHVPGAKMDAALTEAMRVIKPGQGFLYVLEPAIEGAFSDLMRPFHDETEVRGAALEALGRLQARGGMARRTLHYRNQRRFDDFESFVRSVCGTTYNAIARARVDTPAVRECFEAGHDAVAGGFVFEQPMRVDLFTPDDGA